LRLHDIAVVGGGAAGAMAAIRAGQSGKDIILIERNRDIGRKILHTGKGRCNVTNIADIDTFIERFGKQGRFLRSAFFIFCNRDLIHFFEAKGLGMNIERQGRVFPSTNKASSVVRVLKEYLSDNKVEVLYNARLSSLGRRDGFFQLNIKGCDKIYAKRVVMALGGASYRATGSSGDGFRIAESLGHTVVPLKPALVPLKIKEPWVKQLQGLSLENVRISFKYGSKRVTSDIGEFIFTHFGISGPLVLDLSGAIVSLMRDHKEIPLFVDLKPGLEPKQIERRLLNEFGAKKTSKIKNVMKGLLPQKLIPIFIHISGLTPEKEVNQVTREERDAIKNLLKAFPLTATGSLPIEEAMVTGGGISTKEIDPRTMESKIVPGLYFAGEMINGCASSGGYNLQQAFSTGYLAGEKAANA